MTQSKLNLIIEEETKAACLNNTLLIAAGVVE